MYAIKVKMNLRLIAFITFWNLSSQAEIQPCLKSSHPDTRFYLWNESSTSALSYQQHYCPLRCRDGKAWEYAANVDCWIFVCAPCHCRRPACEIYGNCCPDISVPFGRDERKLERSDGAQLDVALISTGDGLGQFHKAIPELGCDRIAHDIAYQYIQSCLPDYKDNQTVVNLCQRRIENQEQSLATFLRVADMTTHVIYKNMFCAICNKVTQFDPLPIEISTRSFLPYLHSRNRDEMLRQQLEDGAELRVRIPKDLDFFDCLFSHRHEVRSCPTTPEDMDVARACSLLTGNNFQVYDSVEQVVYNNIFCAICNARTYPHILEECSCHSGTFSNLPLPFSLLLDLRSNDRTTRTQVSPVVPSSDCFDGWLSPDAECLPLTCAPGKTLELGKCTEVIQELTGLHYHLSLWLKALGTADSLNSTSLVTLNYTFEFLAGQMPSMLNDICDQFVIELNQVDVPDYPSSLNGLYWLDAYFIAFKHVPRADFESRIIHRFTQSSITLNADFNSTTIFEAFFTNNIIKNDSITGLELLKRNRTYLYTKKIKSKKKFTEFSVESLQLTATIVCPFVRFNQSRYGILKDDSILPPNIKVSIYFNTTKMRIVGKDLNQLELDANEELYVCRDLLDSLLLAGASHHDARRTLTGSALAEYIVSMTCFMASTICLTLTLITFFLLPALRTSAGVNNMFLSFSLLLAQVFLLIGSHFTRSSLLCTAIGVTTHFLWLWVFTWGLLCSHHMYKVFAASLRCDSARGATTTLKRGLLSLVAPGTVVAATAGSSYLATRGTEMGYGLNSCYLNSTFLVALTLVGPLALITISNGLFYAAAVYKIYQVRALQPTLAQEEKANGFIYVKLSSVTGAFWLVAIVAAVLESSVLRFLSIILNGMQGVAIFLSFICNKRVLKLYSEKFRSRNDIIVSSRPLPRTRTTTTR